MPHHVNHWKVNLSSHDTGKQVSVSFLIRTVNISNGIFLYKTIKLNILFIQFQIQPILRIILRWKFMKCSIFTDTNLTKLHINASIKIDGFCRLMMVTNASGTFKSELQYYQTVFYPISCSFYLFRSQNC